MVRSSCLLITSINDVGGVSELKWIPFATERFCPCAVEFRNGVSAEGDCSDDEYKRVTQLTSLREDAGAGKPLVSVGGAHVAVTAAENLQITGRQDALSLCMSFHSRLPACMNV